MASSQISLASSFPVVLTLSPFSSCILLAPAAEEKYLNEREHYTCICSVTTAVALYLRGLLNSESDDIENTAHLCKVQKP